MKFTHVWNLWLEAALFLPRRQVDEEQKELAQEYGMTPGKAALLQKLTDANENLIMKSLLRCRCISWNHI